MLVLALCLWLPALAGSSLAVSQENAPEVVRPLLEDAARHRDAGRVDEAIAKYREVLRLAPQLAQVHLTIGALYHRQGKLTEARDAFTAGLERAPDDPVLLYNAAAVELQLGKAAEALAYADRGLARHRDDASLRLIRASALRRLERPEDALREYQEVVRLDARNAAAYLALGNLQHQLDRKKDALESYRQAIRYDKTLLSAYYNLGAVLYELGQDDEALRAYEIALAPAEKDLAAGRTVDASTAQAFLNLGAIYARKQNWARALDAYRAAARLRPDSAPAHYNAGLAQYRLERWDDAQASFARAVELDASLPLAHFHLGMLALRKGQEADALERLERALPALTGADRHTARLTTAQLLAKQGDAPAAESRYREVLSENATDAAALAALGRLLRQRGAIPEAREMIDRARTAAPADLGVALEAAALARTAGDTAAERAIYTDILRRDPDRPDLWPIQVNLVGLLVREGATAEAMRAMDALMRRLPARGTAGAPDASVRRLLHATYASLLAREGQRPAAIREFQAALREDPAFAPALAGLAVLNVLGGDLQESAARLASLHKADAGAMDALARANVGHALWLAGRGAEAAPHLQAALTAIPSYVSVHVALGEIALSSGDRAGAIERLSKGIELCDAKAAAPAAASRAQSLQVAIGGSAAGGQVLCSRARILLGAALVTSAAAEATRRPAEARDLLERAFTMPLDPVTRAKAHYLRGTAQLAAGQNVAARDDLARALAGSLPEDLKSPARNNLGIAHHRTGNIAEAIRQFEAAGRGSAPATLNLAIALHDRGEGARALPLYEQYLKLGGPRADEVRTWVEDLRRIYR